MSGGDSETPRGARDSIEEMEEAAFWLRGYCELASDTLESMRTAMIELNDAVQKVAGLNKEKDS